jgi:ketosteroid isomerase-like protein
MPLKRLDAQLARDILNAAHDAWCKGDIERVLSCYVDDVTYWCNAGALDGTPYIVEGKQAYRTFLRSITAVADSGTVVESFKFEDGVGRAEVGAYIRHRRTDRELRGTYLQIVTYRGRKIAKVEEFHDAVKMAEFWRMVANDETVEEQK